MFFIVQRRRRTGISGYETRSKYRLVVLSIFRLSFLASRPPSERAKKAREAKEAKDKEMKEKEARDKEARDKEAKEKKAKKDAEAIQLAEKDKRQK